MYFLLNYGRGYTGEFVGSLTLEELNWHVHKLWEDLQEKKRLEEKAAQRARSRMRLKGR